ncbi:MAG: c-type cytochrome [Nitrospinota bacterium]|nr:c-type cytochrome [Nitrospinota bacterium]
MKFILTTTISSIFIITFFPASPALAGGDAANGEALFKEKKCHLCHNLTDQSKVGPGLKGDTKRHTTEWLTRWLGDPQKVWEENDADIQKLKTWSSGRESDPKTKMRIKKLNDQEIADLIAFLIKNDETE